MGPGCRWKCESLFCSCVVVDAQPGTCRRTLVEVPAPLPRLPQPLALQPECSPHSRSPCACGSAAKTPQCCAHTPSLHHLHPCRMNGPVCEQPAVHSSLAAILLLLLLPTAAPGYDLEQGSLPQFPSCHGWSVVGLRQHERQLWVSWAGWSSSVGEMLRAKSAGPE